MATEQGPSGRRRLGLRKELLLAVAPTLALLLVLALVEAVSRQRLLFASLASSACLMGRLVTFVARLVAPEPGGGCLGGLLPRTSDSRTR